MTVYRSHAAGDLRKQIESGRGLMEQRGLG